MTDTPELHLKTLRLPTFLREHAKQERICATEGVDYVRYLARLTQYVDILEMNRESYHLNQVAPAAPPTENDPQRMDPMANAPWNVPAV